MVFLHEVQRSTSRLVTAGHHVQRAPFASRERSLLPFLLLLPSLFLLDVRRCLGTLWTGYCTTIEFGDLFHFMFLFENKLNVFLPYMSLNPSALVLIFLLNQFFLSRSDFLVLILSGN